MALNDILKKIETVEDSKPKAAPSWMSQPQNSPSKDEVQTPVKPYRNLEEEEMIIWKYPELKNDTQVTHKIPKVIERAMVSSEDFARWFDTIWMVLSLNARWNLNEVLVPEHLRPLLGCRSIGIDGNWKKPGEVIWQLYL